MKMKYISGLLVFLLLACQPTQKPTKQEVRILPPPELYRDLFYDVQSRSDLFPDSKTFVDVIPKRNVEEILAAYDELENKEDKDVLLKFLEENFKIPGNLAGLEVAESATASEHIKKLWGLLERPADPYASGTLIPLKNPYVVPGGRFREVYYWDSYFTMLGLQVDGKVEFIDNVLENFSFLLDSIGFIPNGNRTYYLGRSQPPFYAQMVDLHVSENGTRTYDYYLPFLLKEYEFWMSGAAELSAENATNRRAVILEGGVLNRYYDDKSTPRPESYREDVETVERAVKANPNLAEETGYRHLRAGAESGWDYSTRWFEIGADGNFDLSTIHTTDILPVDLNSLLYNLELTIAKGYSALDDTSMEDEWIAKSEARKALIHMYCWNDSLGFFMDYDFVKAEQTPVKSLAGVYPLFFGLATEDQASRVAKVIESEFLQPGGVVTTLNNSGQQWDYPNGWAPLQWMTVKGLNNYGQAELSNEIAKRWLDLNDKVFRNTGKMTEKYNVVDLSLDGGGGEYPNQDGFGWTNGVYQKLNSEKR